MKIALWNVDHAWSQTKNREAPQRQVIEAVETDIFIFTEASLSVEHSKLPFARNSEELPEQDERILIKSKYFDTPQPVKYKRGEVRTRILSRYPIIKQLPCTSTTTNCCVDIQMPDKSVGRVLACVVGVVLIPYHIWEDDFYNLEKDLSMWGDTPNFVLAGDFNIPIPPPIKGDMYKKRRAMLTKLLDKHNLHLLPTKKEWVVDHVAISSNFHKLEGREVRVHDKNKKLSDHCLIEAVI